LIHFFASGTFLLIGLEKELSDSLLSPPFSLFLVYIWIGHFRDILLDYTPSMGAHALSYNLIWITVHSIFFPVGKYHI